MLYDLTSVYEERLENEARAEDGKPSKTYLKRTGEEGRPLVSVGMTTYNQRFFVTYAIESILKQVVDFTYEIVIADDCSTDGTREIVVELAERYPGTIRLILQEVNVGVKQQSIDLKRACRGVYRAHLEGDDYWTHVNMLKKLVDFLEMHEDYIAVAGKPVIVDELNLETKFPDGNLSNVYKLNDDYILADFEKWLLPSHTSSLVYRNFYYDCDEQWLSDYEDTFLPGDRKTALYLVTHGNVRVLNFTVSARRILLESKSNFTATMKKLRLYSLTYDWMTEAENYGKRLYDVDLDMRESKKRQLDYAINRWYREPTASTRAQVKAIAERMNNPWKCRLMILKRPFALFKSRTKRKGFFSTLAFLVRKAPGLLRRLSRARSTKHSDELDSSSSKVLFGESIEQ